MQITVVAIETCRYFPDWADRPVSPGSFHEAERNSYAAGGYAEEFGHRARQIWDAAPLDGRLVYVEGLHAGYPECPRPCDGVAEADEPRHPQQRRAEQSSPQTSRDTRTIRVGNAPRDRDARKPFAALLLKWHELRVRHRQFGVFS